MFERWRVCGSTHEVTIVMFSRCFYDAKDKSEFPQRMLDCLQTSADDGSFYEDFYRVVVQVRILHGST